MSIEAKKALRRQMKQMRAGIDAEALAAAGTGVVPHVLRWLDEHQVDRVMIYVSFRRELPTLPLIEALGASGREVAVPRIVGPELQPRLLRAWSELQPGSFGVDTSDGEVLDGLGACLCPGLAFDRSGGRLGYGGGFYDRFLGARPDTVPVALCGPGAVVDQVPIDEHDVLMQQLITPAGPVL